MRTLIGKDENAWINLAWTWVHEEVTPGQKVFVPAGGTPQPLYRRWTAEPTSLLRSLHLMQIDEIISGPQKGHFKQFFEAELPDYKVEWIDKGDATADVSILGVGVNGHVAFHEPGLPRNFSAGCVRLSDETCGYLQLKEPTWGLTYGVGTFWRSKKILVLVKGARKQAIMKRAMQKRDLPISWILDHPGVTVVSDFSLG
jgi:6-phosphogluconolactonase/glucosamine-6-phosphate isomerase/deaminase